MATMYRYGRGRRVFRRRAAAVVSSMLARKTAASAVCDARHVSPGSSFLGCRKDPKSPPPRGSATTRESACGLRRARARDTSRRDAL